MDLETTTFARGPSAFFRQIEGGKMRRRSSRGEKSAGEGRKFKSAEFPC